MPSTVKFQNTGAGASDPAAHLLQIATALRPTVGDALYGGQLLITRIADKTLSGVDFEGSPFAPYSLKYARRKARKGASGIVDLFGAGSGPHMLNALQVMAGGQTSGQSSEPVDFFEVGIFGNGELEMRAAVHNNGTGARNIPQRRFLDATAEDRAMIEAAMGFRINSRIKTLIQ